MSGIEFSLFGKFRASCDGDSVDGLAGGKPLELLCYLLLFRERPHPREVLADLLWQDSPRPQCRKYLRQALWQLHRAIKPYGLVTKPLIGADEEWIQLNMEEVAWLDVDEVERAYASVKGIAGERMEDTQAAAVRQAVELCRADLLEGRYQDWCVFERERLKTIYLSMLEKLLALCEHRQEFETGLLYGGLILHHDRAHERTHVRLMRMHFLAGDRTGALRQFNACASALDEELGVEPSARTITLHESIRADRIVDLTESLDQGPAW